MAETTATAKPTQAQAASPADPVADDRQEVVTVVMEVTLTKTVPAGDSRAAAQAEADVQRAGTFPEGYEEATRRVKSVRVRPA